MEKIQATCAIITNDKDELLLIRRGRDPFSGYWALVSGIGATRNGLAPEEAILDEVMCDLQTDFSGKLIFSLPIENDDYVNEAVVFLGKVDESKIKVNPPYSLEYKWFSLAEINTLGKLAYEHREIIDRYFRMK